MKYFSNFKKGVQGTAFLAATCFSSLCSANVTFTEIPVDNWGGFIAVSNSGDVAFSGDTTFYKWSLQSGLTVLGDVADINGWVRVAAPYISDDGNVVAFKMNVWTPSNTYVYTGSEERIISDFQTSILSNDGSSLGGRSYSTGTPYAATLNLVDNSITSYNDISGVHFDSVVSISDSGESVLLNAGFVFGDHYIFTAGTAPQLIEGIDLMHGMSSNGQVVVGESYDCEDNSWLCTVMWSKDTQQVTELGYFRPTDVNASGTMVIGNGWSNEPGTKIWDAINGKRDLLEVLIANGIDMTGWSNFTGAELSSDGNKIAGYATNPDGKIRPYLISITPICSVF